MEPLNLHQLLVHLEVLRSNKNWDGEDRSLILQHEIIVANYEALQAIRENPMFQALMKLYREELDGIKLWLAENAKYLIPPVDPKVQQQAVFFLAKQNVISSFIEHFNQDPVELINSIKMRVEKAKSAGNYNL